MKLGVSDKDQTQVKHAFSSLWDVCGNLWNNIFDNTDKAFVEHEEMHIKIKDLEEQVRTLKEERNVHDK